MPHDHERHEAHQAVAERDDDARRQRQLGAEAGEQAGERRDDLPQNDADDDRGDHDDGDGIDHRRLHLALQLDGLLDVGRQPLENGVEDAARLAGRDHVGEQRVERPSGASSSRRPATRRFRRRRGWRGSSAPKFLSSSCVPRISRHCTSGRPASIITENCRVNTARFFGVDALLALDRHRLGGLAAFSLTGLILVTRICSRRSAATAASIVSAIRSPVTFCPARVRPLYANVAIRSPTLPSPPTGRACGPRARPRPAPATTPTPRMIMSCSSSRFDDALSACSSVTCFR